jgi:membrane protease subunit HflK
MAPLPPSDDDKRKTPPQNPPKNPWGRPDSSRPGDRQKNPWGAGGGGRGGDTPPDLDEILRRAQENFRQAMPPGMRHGGGFAGLFAIALIALWLASGFFTIQPGENGVILRFGKLQRTQTAEGLGYHFPWPIETLTKVNVSHLQSMEIGFVSGGARTASRGQPDESLMLTSDTNIVDVEMTVLWNIKSAEDYLFNIKDPENTIRKVAESAIREVAGQTEMFQFITQARGQAAQRTREIMMKNLDDYHSGVNISQVLIGAARVHPDVNDAFQDVQSAKQDAQNVQNQAEAYRQSILPGARAQAFKMRQDAEAYKQTAVDRAQGDAQRFNAMYESYLGAKDVTKERMYIETMEDVLGNAQKTIIDGKAGSVLPYLPLGDMTAQKPAHDFGAAGNGRSSMAQSLGASTDKQQQVTP